MASTNIIAAAVQRGQEDILELWKAVSRFALKMAHRWNKAIRERDGVTMDDLQQTAFLALVDALNHWEPERGSFLTLYGMRLKTAFTAVYGLRTERDKRDPLNNFPLALDTPLDEDSDLTLVDIIPDPLAETAFDDLPLKIAIQDALAVLPPEEQRAIASEFWYGQRADTKTRNSALRCLRHPTISRSLKHILIISGHVTRKEFVNTYMREKSRNGQK